MSRRPGAAGRRRGLEACKTAIIVLLTASAVLLTLTAARYSGSGWDGLEQLAARIAGQETPPPRKAEEPSHIDAALPLVVTVRGSAGRTSFQGDFAAIDAAFERLGSHLAAALDTAGNAQSIPESELIRAATGNSLCFFYPGDIPLQLLADWLDANAAELGLSGRDFVLVVRDGTVQLLVGGQDGCWRLETQADAASLADALDDDPADGTLLAAESADYGRLDGLTLIDPSVTALPAADAANPWSDTFLTATAETLGFNPYGDTTYQDRTGNVYTETDCTLRIDADCVLSLRNQGLAERFSAASAASDDCVEYLRALLVTLTSGLETDARLYCTGLTEDGDVLRVEFSYFLAGRPVRQPSGTAVTASFEDGVLSELTFRIRAYTLRSGETLALLPAAQIAAVAPEGQRLVAGYADSGDTALTAGWLRQDSQ